MGKQHSKVTGRYRASFSECPLQTPNAFIPAGCFQGTHPKKPDDSFPPCRPSCNEKLSSSRTLTVIFMDSHGWSWMTKAKGSKRFRNISNLLCLMTCRTLLKRFEHNLTHMNTMFFASGPQVCLFSSHHGAHISSVHFPTLHRPHKPGGGFEEVVISHQNGKLLAKKRACDGGRGNINMLVIV
jgi:hypothetical protein